MQRVCRKAAMICGESRRVICGSIVIHYSDLRSSKPEIMLMLICGDLRFLGRPNAWLVFYLVS